MAAKRDIDKLWDQKSETIRHFLEDHPSYEQLSSEVAYILRKRVKEADIECSAVTHRAKTLNSSLEKVSLKHTENPFTEITDLAGVRIVYLYKNDFGRIEKIIEEEFKILNKDDKREEQDPDRFGYDAVHYIVQLGRKSSGARYDDLKEFRCEIQVRTVMQDAWAIVSHHLVYKREADIPKPLMRNLNTLSAVFENADNQFDSIRVEREQYVKKVEKSSTTEDDFLALEINVDTVAAFIKKRFPDINFLGSAAHISFVLSNLDKERYKTLHDFSEVLRRTKKAFEKFNRIIQSRLTAIEALSMSLSIVDRQHRLKAERLDHVINAIEQVEHLLED